MKLHIKSITELVILKNDTTAYKCPHVSMFVVHSEETTSLDTVSFNNTLIFHVIVETH